MIYFLGGLAIGFFVGFGVTAIVLGSAIKELRAQLNREICEYIKRHKHID